MTQPCLPTPEEFSTGMTEEALEEVLANVPKTWSKDTDLASVLSRIYHYNNDRGYIKEGYDAKREASYPIEEALEGFDDLPFLTRELNITDEEPKDIAREIVRLASTKGMDLTPIEALDKHLDILVYSFGSIMKLGLNPASIVEALHIVMNANETKGITSDSEGKNIKGDNFIPPEERLSNLLKNT